MVLKEIYLRSGLYLTSVCDVDEDMGIRLSQVSYGEMKEKKRKESCSLVAQFIYNFSTAFLFTVLRPFSHFFKQ